VGARTEALQTLQQRRAERSGVVRQSLLHQHLERCRAHGRRHRVAAVRGPVLARLNLKRQKGYEVATIAATRTLLAAPSRALLLCPSYFKRASFIRTCKITSSDARTAEIGYMPPAHAPHPCV
jgi:hypothetical protein